MRIFRNISLRPFNTFRLDYKSDCLIQIRTEKEALDLLNNTNGLRKPILVLGAGSNILFTNDFQGTVICPLMTGIKIERHKDREVLISAGAGVKWDKLVEWSVSRGFGGLENLSYIPGTVGAAPVQNIGAYGVEVRESIYQVRALCIDDGSVRVFNNLECQFGYRSSIFKDNLRGRYLITRVYFKLTRPPILNVDYLSLKAELEKDGEVTQDNVRKAVIRVRMNKLPDPDVIGNAGSFFKNPVVSREKGKLLKARYPELPVYDDPSGGVKLAAGWMIEQCGWKGKRIGDAGVHSLQALVLVNHGNATGKDIYNLSEKIMDSVREEFGVELVREAEVF